MGYPVIIHYYKDADGGFLSSRMWKGVSATSGSTWVCTGHCSVSSHHEAGRLRTGEMVLSILELRTTFITTLLAYHQPENLFQTQEAAVMKILMYRN